MLHPPSCVFPPLAAWKLVTNFRVRGLLLPRRIHPEGGLAEWGTDQAIISLLELHTKEVHKETYEWEQQALKNVYKVPMYFHDYVTWWLGVFIEELIAAYWSENSFLWEQKMHCTVHRITSYDPMLSQFIPAHKLTSDLSDMYFNIILLFAHIYSR